jgi:hypothetical protein
MIIGISGKMGTGKTTLAKHLVALMGGRVASFADELRLEVSELFEIPVSSLVSRECKENMTVAIGQRRMTVRELLQWWGALRRETDADYWVDRLVASVGLRELVFVDDVRYYNEAAAIRAAGGQVFRLDPYDGWLCGVGSDHLSETDLDDGFAFDWRSGPAFGALQPLAEQLAGLIG